MDVNGALADLRAAYVKWAGSDPNSADEQRWAGVLANQFTELDAHLSRGGQLPADWDVCPPPAPTKPDLIPEVAADLRDLIARGAKIQAIKLVRSAVPGMSLREAKAYVGAL